MKRFESHREDRLTKPWYVNQYDKESGCWSQQERAEYEARSVLAEAEAGSDTQHMTLRAVASRERMWAPLTQTPGADLAADLAAILPALDELELQSPSLCSLNACGYHVKYHDKQ